MVKRQLKLSLWFVGVGFFVGLFAAWHAWRQIGLGGEGEDRFLLSTTVVGALALAWFGLLITYFSAERFMRSPTGWQQHRKSHIPWWVLKCTVLLGFIAAMSIAVSRLSARVADEFTLLEKGRLVALGERIVADPGTLERKDRKSGLTLLEMALERGNPEAVELLLSNGADLSSAAGGSNLFVALNNLPLLGILLRHGVEPDAPDANGMAPIHYAVEMQNTEVLAMLLEAGADANARDPLDQTPLVLAVMADRLSLAETLIEHGADPNQGDRRGDTALHKAVRRRNIQTVRLLLENGADPNTFNFNNMAPIHIAALNGQNELVELFLEQPDSVNLRNADDRTPFDHALRGHRYETARLLLRNGANIDRVMANGYTALHLMAIAKDYESAEFLIEEGADVYIADSEGETAHDLMRETRLQSLLNLVDVPDNPEASTNAVEAVDAP
ncbi:MAG: ankyrin repeat domain-containing protein [Verrucomicrobia bacterium]|nr:ankyrin repeat domain-containing protein [Verrucomicrobiota bacterium]